MFLMKNTEVERHDDTINASVQLFILNASKGVRNWQLDCVPGAYSCVLHCWKKL